MATILEPLSYVGGWIIVPILIFATWRLADWKNWRAFYPTILFMICVNLFSSLLMYQHSLWFFHETLFLPNHTVTDFFIVFVQFPMFALIYLSNYPKQWLLQIGYIIVWVFLFSAIELFFYQGGKISYQNGWSMGWSVLFNCVMFPILGLHHKKPLWAWVLTIPFLIFILLYFDFSFQDMK